MLRTHFDDPGKVRKRIVHANNAMENLHYAKESIFPFSSYVTGLNTCCTTLAQAGHAVTARNKVAKMLNGTTTMNPSLVTAMQNIRSNVAMKNDFAAASSKLSEQIALIFPEESRQTSTSCGKRVSGELARTTVREVEAEDMEMAKEVDAEEDVVEDMEEGVVEEAP